MQPIEQNQANQAYLMPAEAAAALRVSTSTVARMADAGRIGFIRPGSHRRYLAADVAAIASEGTS